MKSFALICLVSGALAAPFTGASDNAVDKRAAAVGVEAVATIVTSAVGLIHDIEIKVQAAVKAGKSAQDIIPEITGGLTSLNSTISGLNGSVGTVAGSASSVVGLTGILGGLGVGGILGAQGGLDISIIANISTHLSILLSACAGLLTTVNTVPGLTGGLTGAGVSVTAVLSAVLGGVPGLNSIGGLSVAGGLLAGLGL